MTKNEKFVFTHALICLLNIQLSNQIENKEIQEARDKYIKSTIKLLEGLRNGKRI